MSLFLPDFASKDARMKQKPLTFFTTGCVSRHFRKRTRSCVRRTLIGKGEGAKYMNTGDTLIYNKRHNIYAINLMKGRKLDELIMVEGYMDVISLHQAGIDNAVASLGTALTSQQVRLMGRFAKRVCYAYDGDSAGQKAMLRGVDIIARGELEPRVIVIPGGLDPDEFVRANGAEAFLKLKDASLTAVMFKLETMANAVDLNTADGRQKYASDACRLLASLEPVERDRYIKVVSEKSGIAREVIQSQCGVDAERAEDGIAPATAKPHSTPSDTKNRRMLKKREKAEQLLLACMLVSRQDAAAIEQLENFSTELFSTPGTAKFAAMLTEAYKTAEKPDIRLLLAELNGDESEIAGCRSCACRGHNLLRLNPPPTALTLFCTINTVSAYDSLQHFPKRKPTKPSERSFCANR